MTSHDTPLAEDHGTAINKGRLSAKEFAAFHSKNPEEVARIVEAVRKSMQPVRMQITVREGGITRTRNVVRHGIGLLETPFGLFWQIRFRIDDQWETYDVLWRGDVDIDNNFALLPKDPSRVVMRTDSGCKTGQVFHDKTCDCREQLHHAMEHIDTIGEGMIIHIPGQDGRGMRLHFKLGTLTLQQILGADTIESARLLTEDGVIDCRTYDGIIAILKYLGFGPGTTVNLVTNNPHKKVVFADNGYKLTATPIHVVAPESARRHMIAKEEHLGHQGLGSNGKAE